MTARRGFLLSDYGDPVVVYLDEVVARSAAEQMNRDGERERAVYLNHQTRDQTVVLVELPLQPERFIVAEVWFIPTEDGGAIIPAATKRLNVAGEKS